MSIPWSVQGSKMLFFGCIYIIFLIQTSCWTRHGKCREEDGKAKDTALASSSATWSSVELSSGLGQGWETLVFTSEAAGNLLGELGQDRNQPLPFPGLHFSSWKTGQTTAWLLCESSGSSVTELHTFLRWNTGNETGK